MSPKSNQMTRNIFVSLKTDGVLFLRITVKVNDTKFQPCGTSNMFLSYVACLKSYVLVSFSFLRLFLTKYFRNTFFYRQSISKELENPRNTRTVRKVKNVCAYNPRSCFLVPDQSCGVFSRVQIVTWCSWCSECFHVVSVTGCDNESADIKSRRLRGARRDSVFAGGKRQTQ